MLINPTILEAAPITPIGVFRAQLFATTPILRLATSTALLGEDLNRIADSVFFLGHQTMPFSLRY